MDYISYIKKANEFLKNAYVPYSKFPVSAIVIDGDGNEYAGVNVENAGYPLSTCAERNAITTAVTNGLKNIKYIFVTANTDKPVSPCGACRQIISEFSTKDTIIVLGCSKSEEYMVYDMEGLLPYFFSKADL